MDIEEKEKTLMYIFIVTLVLVKASGYLSAHAFNCFKQRYMCTVSLTNCVNLESNHNYTMTTTLKVCKRDSRLDKSEVCEGCTGLVNAPRPVYIVVHHLLQPNQTICKSIQGLLSNYRSVFQVLLSCRMPTSSSKVDI